MKTNIQEFALGEEFQAALDDIEEIRLKSAGIRKESQKMIEHLVPKIKELGKKIRVIIDR